jgi:hypothetical protein
VENKQSSNALSYVISAFGFGIITMIRCDDIFVDSDVRHFEKICQIIRRYEPDHIIGITPIGEGKKLWAGYNGAEALLWKINSLTRYGFLINYRLKKITGQKCIKDNMQLHRFLDSEFSKYGAIPALHGLHHYKYSNLPQNEVYEELSAGINLLKELFNVRVRIFAPPFNAWNKNTELVCKSLNLSIDKCTTGFDKLIKNMNGSQIEQLAKRQSSSPEVYYHPYRILNLGKFELYLKTRREYLLQSAKI